MLIEYPDRLTTDSAFEFLRNLDSVWTEPEIEISFGKIVYALPFSTLLTAVRLRDWIEYRKNRELQTSIVCPVVNSAVSYLGHIGFFRFIGHDYGKFPGEAGGSSSYMPIRILHRQEIEVNRARSGDVQGKTISKISDEIALVLTGKHQFKTNAPISYCIREIVRNVFEHAETDVCFICAQRWPNENVEIAIIDNGCGIPNSLEKKHRFASPAEALQMSIKPGISRSEFTDTENVWANSGFGLYVLSEIGKQLGSFTICTRGASLEIQDNKAEFKDFSFPGTAIGLTMNRPWGENFKEYIEATIARGERIASGEHRQAFASGSTRTITFK